MNYLYLRFSEFSQQSTGSIYNRITITPQTNQEDVTWNEPHPLTEISTPVQCLTSAATGSVFGSRIDVFQIRCVLKEPQKPREMDSSDVLKKAQIWTVFSSRSWLLSLLDRFGVR